MKWILKTFNFYINSSIHVSLAVVALQLVTYQCLDIKWDNDLLFFTFFASITGYNFIKYSKLAKLHHLSLTESLRVIQVFSLFCFMAMLFFLTKVALNVVVACSALGVITGLYALPIFSRKRNLRSLNGVKIYTIAVVWAGVTVVLPILQESISFSWDEGLLFIQRFLFILVITLPFDIRDVKYDAEVIGTIPLQIGIKKAQFLGIFLLILMVLLEALKDEITSEIVLSTVVISIFSGVLLLRAKKKQSKFYASFFVESLPIIWFLILWVLSFY